MLLRKTIPVARRVLGDSNEITIRMRWSYAEALYPDTSATLEDLREAANTLEDTERTARRVLGGAHPTAVAIEQSLYNVRAALRARGKYTERSYKFRGSTDCHWPVASRFSGRCAPGCATRAP